MKKYLEIGVDTGYNIEKIQVNHKDGVDPGQNVSKFVNFNITSDDFFEKIKNQDIKYDFIFIDGLHITDQVDRDIENSLNHLNENGIIMLHDANPPTFEHQIVPQIQAAWTGDVWKSVVKLRYKNPNVKIFTIDTDHGCAILKKEKCELYNKVDLDLALTWEYFKNNRTELLNLISIDKFLNII